jgi:hypothetical protein
MSPEKESFQLLTQIKRKLSSPGDTFPIALRLKIPEGEHLLLSIWLDEAVATRLDDEFQSATLFLDP